MRAAEGSVLAKRSVRPPGGDELLCGWGRIAPSRAHVRCAGGIEEIAAALAAGSPTGRGLIARGAGRSYGDAAQVGGGEVLDMTGLTEIAEIDRERSTVTAQAGVTLAALMAHLAREGLTLPVLPGTRYVTVGGAIASDIHGKSHHVDGSFANQVRSLSLCLPGGELVEVSAQSDRELFDTTLGGMGLTGVVVQATLAVEPLRGAWVSEDSDRTNGIEETIELLSGPESSRFSVAWLDLLARGSALGRAIVSRADPCERAGYGVGDRGESRGGGALRLADSPRIEVPKRVPGLLRPGVVRAFNAARWRRAPRRERARRVALGAYLFPLDAIGSWSRLYGRGGLVQYQFVVPPGAERELVACVRLLEQRRLPVYLAVLKRFGAFRAGPLSFPIEGFTLAMDLPGGAPGLWGALDELDEIVAGAGGRVYLTKDVRLRKDLLPVMYPELDNFRAVRARVDPNETMRSDLSRRLGL
jgi:decaprenylphospho-beta-D-ribofuranose 2-oxidase